MTKLPYERAAVVRERTISEWCCATCGAVYGDQARAKDNAARCCADEAPCRNEHCNNIIDYRNKYKGYSRYHDTCQVCEEGKREAVRQKRVDKWQKLEKVAWDGKAMLFSDAFDVFFQGLDEAFDRYEDWKSEGLVEKPDDMLLLICSQPRPCFNASDYFSDYLPDDDYYDTLPGAEELERVVNEFIADAPLAWEPTNKALNTSLYDFEGTHYHRNYVSPFTGEVK